MLPVTAVPALWCLLLVMSTLHPLVNAAGSGQRPYDVLMIAVDDLRTELSIYPEGASVPMHTPNIERIAERGLVFERAYVQVALCMPSRTSLLTSRRPDTSRSWTIEADQYWRKSGGNFTTLPQHFMNVRTCMHDGWMVSGTSDLHTRGSNSFNSP